MENFARYIIHYMIWIVIVAGSNLSNENEFKPVYQIFYDAYVIYSID